MQAAARQLCVWSGAVHRADHIVAAQAGCNTAEQLVRDEHGELPVIGRAAPGS